MKALRKTDLIILTLLFLTNGLIYAQNPAEDNYAKGLEYAVQGNFVKAKEEFEKAMKAGPFHSGPKRCLEKINDLLEQKIKKEFVIHLFKGLAFFSKNQYNQALSDYTKAIEINPKDADAYYNRGIVYFYKAQYDQTIEVHGFSVKVDSMTILSSAISDYTKAIEMDPKFADAYYSRGIVYFNKSQYDEAVNDYTRGIEINPKFAKAYKSRGDIYFNKEQYGQAINDYTKAIEIDPKFADAYYRRGDICLSKGQHGQAIGDYTKVIEINPMIPKAYYDRGFAYQSKGQFDKAISDYTKAIEIHKGYGDAYVNRGIIYYEEKGYWDKGCADFKKACEYFTCETYNFLKENGSCP